MDSSSRRSASRRIVPLGLCGEFTMIARVRGVTAARTACQDTLKPALIGTVTALPPASSMFGT